MLLITKKRLIAIGLVIMVILNIIILGTLWYKESTETDFRHSRDTGFPQQKVPRFIMNQLQLDKRQKQQFKAIHRDHMQRLRQLRIHSSKSRRKLFSLLHSSNTKHQTSIRDSLISRIGRYHVRMERAIFEHLREVRKLCRPAQLKYFDKMINKIIPRMGPGPPIGRPGRGPGFKGPHKPGKFPHISPRDGSNPP